MKTRLIHQDTGIHNTVIDLLHEDRFENKTFQGVLDSSNTQYAIIDFDASAIFPMDGTDIKAVVCEREMRIGVARLGFPPVLCNPFEDDVLVLMDTLQSYIIL
ncbi:hypothetical protein BKA70DRAFT_1292956 [Coprinopsis sp. MPI-PUGE-AT-0042]|nr:hypothetical protein BKA70DRAFT_1292956 [Coprinopsis sp. MPI-PUGE-AT-0042]